MKKILHRIIHSFGCYYGTIESFYIGDTLWIGFKCSTCHEINHARSNEFIR